ncbi:hypothetical protein C8R47DRAFT_539147 [Mycena vitilis]|nr:hypothetical protein C8R47DRAFT_539147 [Mycena vitilis]
MRVVKLTILLDSHCTDVACSALDVHHLALPICSLCQCLLSRLLLSSLTPKNRLPSLTSSGGVAMLEGRRSALTRRRCPLVLFHLPPSNTQDSRTQVQGIPFKFLPELSSLQFRPNLQVLLLVPAWIVIQAQTLSYCQPGLVSRVRPHVQRLRPISTNLSPCQGQFDQKHFALELSLTSRFCAHCDHKYMFSVKFFVLSCVFKGCFECL